MIVEAGGVFSEIVKTYLMELCDPSALAGEQGYYLTAFEAALEFVKSADVEAMKQQFQEEFAGCETPPESPVRPGRWSKISTPSPKKRKS